ncbi:DUF4845 domain-containing protein [Methylotenera versatilis]|uniref:Transmembrane protein n=1 Tax=Methylotenera versatilis (strain 301) TaxID=666681 RepID=D7DJV7_METV0|nr:DUF4845 domain-containing protein [Methylotenera versatilis]ADI30318.1 transmembrane protein [Methylotenera versatilis 301]
MINLQKKSPGNLKKQAGATLLGMLFVGAMLFFVAVIAMKIFPAYQEYFSVKTVIRAMNKESLNDMSKKEIQDSFNKRADTSYVTVVHGSDLIIGKNSAGETTVSAQYQVVTPLFGNISVMMDFDASPDGK